MESNFKNRDFEQFVKQNADQYRMFPSEKVWAGIDKALHTRRRWYGLGLALLLLLTGAGVTWVMMTTPIQKDHAAVSNAVIPTAESKQGKADIPGTSNTSRTPGPIVSTNTQRNTDLKNSIPYQTFLTSENQLDENGVPDIATISTSGNELSNSFAEEISSFRKTSPAIAFITPDISAFAPSFTQPQLSYLAQQPTATRQQKDDRIAQNKPQADIYPLTIESVLNIYSRPPFRKTPSLQLYFAPTVSYRMLSENKEFLRTAAASGNVPNYAAYSDVKNYVTHKPDIGLELGLALKYPITRKFLVKGALQFNVSRYDIRAFSNPSEEATITLDASVGNNTITRTTTYRTRSGSRANWLQNLYYSASIPVGVEYKLSENQDKYFSVGASIQPTYVISDRAYLISTDYKNYMEVPGRILRRWNLNTSVEALFGYSTDKFHWQIGPQIRYQVQSTFQDKYPVKENLFDFGLKVGVMLNK